MWKDYQLNWLDLKNELNISNRKPKSEFWELRQGNDFNGFLTKFRLLTNQLVDTLNVMVQWKDWRLNIITN